MRRRPSFLKTDPRLFLVQLNEPLSLSSQEIFRHVFPKASVKVLAGSIMLGIKVLRIKNL